MSSRERARRPAVSVIIPALNEAKYIKEVMEGLRNQTLGNFEVIVVDGGSTDSTVKIARGYGARVVIDKGGLISESRNRGARIARGGILFFTNADTRPAPHAIETYLDVFKEKNVVAATGPLDPLEESDAILRFCYKFVSVGLAQFAMAVGAPSISGSNFAVRRSAFMRAGGFDEKFKTYEDLDLSNRLKHQGRIAYSQGALVHTSARRIKAWGIPKYIYFNAANVARYYLFATPKEEYEPIR